MKKLEKHWFIRPIFLTDVAESELALAELQQNTWRHLTCEIEMFGTVCNVIL